MNASQTPLSLLIDRFEAGGPLLAQAASGLTPEQASAHPIPGTWSVAEVVVHLLDSDLVFADRIKRLIAEDDPTLQGFDENAWIAKLDPNAMPIGEATALFEANRRWITRILRAQDESTFARAGTHSQAGRVTLAEIVVKAANHLDHHLKFLYAKRASLGLAIYPRYTANSGV